MQRKAKSRTVLGTKGKSGHSKEWKQSTNYILYACGEVFCKIFTVFGDELMEQTATQTASTLNIFESQFLGIPRRGKEQHERTKEERNQKEKT